RNELMSKLEELEKWRRVTMESEERYRTLVQNVPIGVYRTTPGPKGKFLIANPTYLKMFGLGSEEELKKISVADVHINPKNRKAFSDNLLAKGRVDGVELPLRRKDGTIFWGSVTARVVYNENGKNPYFDCTIIDITERKKIEEERETLIKELKEGQALLKKQKKEVEDSRKAIKNVAEDLVKSKQILEEQKNTVENINKELDDFTYIISHDLKEPLRSIDAFSKFIRDDYKDKLDEEGRNYLERIRANTGRMQNLIEDLLEISRLERRKNPLEEVEIEELINEAKLRLEYAIRQKNVEVVVRDKLPKIFCDHVRLAEVFVNLISNAIKFNDKARPCIEIGCSQKSIFYEIYVKDNGPGIEERYFDKIFEIFQRLGKREDREGTGAGLTIVKKIVEMHKGRIWVESKIGKGSTFYFTIPMKKELILGKKKIGEILIEKKLVAEEEVRKALEEQERMG
ncbi:MAG: ATP-binding protein, partial [bacterium]